MTYHLISLALFLFAVLFVAAVLLAPVAAVAGSVLHVWGTSSALEWITEAVRRTLVGGIRRRFMRAVNAQRHIAVDRSRRTCAYIAVSISSADCLALAGTDGELARLALDAARGYMQYARANGLTCDALPQVVVTPAEWLRRGTVKARPISGAEFADLWSEMLTWDRDGTVVVVSAPTVSPDLADADLGSLVLPGTAQTQVAEARGGAGQAPAAPCFALTDASGTRHTVASTSAIVGRGHDCGIRFDSPEVSREHVDVYFQEGKWWLRDRGSRNGTIVDGRQIRGAGPVRLIAGTRVILGSATAGEQLTVAGMSEL